MVRIVLHKTRDAIGEARTASGLSGWTILTLLVSCAKVQSRPILIDLCPKRPGWVSLD